MRTTLQLDDTLIAEAKVVAVRTGRTLSQVIEDACGRPLYRDRVRAGSPLFCRPVPEGHDQVSRSTATSPFATGWTSSGDPLRCERAGLCGQGGAPRHVEWRELADAAGARGNAIPDAYLAALAIESGSEWITADQGFLRYPGLRWRHPLDEAEPRRNPVDS